MYSSIITSYSSTPAYKASVGLSSLMPVSAKAIMLPLLFLYFSNNVSRYCFLRPQFLFIFFLG